MPDRTDHGVRVYRNIEEAWRNGDWEAVHNMGGMEQWFCDEILGKDGICTERRDAIVLLSCEYRIE